MDEPSDVAADGTKPGKGLERRVGVSSGRTFCSVEGDNERADESPPVLAEGAMSVEGRDEGLSRGVDSMFAGPWSIHKRRFFGEIVLQSGCVDLATNNAMFIFVELVEGSCSVSCPFFS